MENWRSSETLAWTRRDGVPAPPRGQPAWLLGGLALAMGGAWIGMFATDTLCPEHRAWVISLGTAAMIGTLVAVIGLLGRRSWAPLAALGSALLGVIVGFIDATHSPTRGALISVAFTVTAVVLLAVVIPQFRSWRWAIRTERDLARSTPSMTAEAASTTGASSALRDGDVASQVADHDVLPGNVAAGTSPTE